MGMLNIQIPIWQILIILGISAIIYDLYANSFFDILKKKNVEKEFKKRLRRDYEIYSLTDFWVSGKSIKRGMKIRVACEGSVITGEFIGGTESNWIAIVHSNTVSQLPLCEISNIQILDSNIG